MHCGEGSAASAGVGLFGWLQWLRRMRTGVLNYSRSGVVPEVTAHHGRACAAFHACHIALARG